MYTNENNSNYLISKNRIGGVMVSVVRLIMGSNPDQVKLKTIKLVFVPSPLIMQRVVQRSYQPLQWLQWAKPFSKTAKEVFLICWEQGTLQVSYNYPLMTLYGPYCLPPHPLTKKGTSYPSLGVRWESLSLKPCVPPLIPNSYVL